jgi:predicted O-linked N-acetylglucosamine transferase (SPINDLY family)
MDYLFSDETTIPPKAARDYSEEVVYLPSILTYLPQGEPPPVGPLPAAANGHVTYGCLNSYAKLTPQSLETWALLLARFLVPRMLFKAGEFDYRSLASGCCRSSTGTVSAAERLEFAGATPWRKHLAAYGAVDVGARSLPPRRRHQHPRRVVGWAFPWSRCAAAVVGGRMAAALLAVVGLEEWVADDREGYLAIGRGGAGGSTARGTARSAEGAHRRHTRRRHAGVRALGRIGLSRALAALVPRTGLGKQPLPS